MRSTWIHAIGGLGTAAVLSVAAVAEQSAPVKDALARAFPEATVLESRWIAVSSNQVERVETEIGRQRVPTVVQVHTTRQRVASGSREKQATKAVSGYAIVYSVPGKHGPIRLLVATTPQLAVVRTEILAFRERRGRAVQRQSFLSQFVGKTRADELALRSDIDAVTGATVSSRAVAQGVREALALLSVIIPPESPRSDDSRE